MLRVTTTGVGDWRKLQVVSGIIRKRERGDKVRDHIHDQAHRNHLGPSRRIEHSPAASAMAEAYADAAPAGGHEARRTSAMIGAGDLNTLGIGIGRPASCA